jgi:AraC family transcriptional regulator of arabinose operon
MARVDDYCAPAAPIYGDRFAEASGAWRSRGIGDWLIMLTFAGECRIAYPGGEHRSRPGDIDLIAPRVPQDYGRLPDGRWGVLWVVFQPRPEWLEWLQWPGPATGYGHLHLGDAQVRERVERHLDDAQGLARAGLPNRDLLAMNALEAALLWCWNAGGNSRGEPRLRRAVEHICRELARPLSLSHMARAAGVSKPHFSRLFRRHLGTTPQRFLEDRRLERACELLRATPLPVQEIAERCGFSSPFYFTARFTRRFGVAPRRYRSGSGPVRS